MKKLYFIISLFLITLLNLLPAQAQKVGLVLSGGGAKGLTHIGIIRALEENNIPIDYITGTSMGAIIGSLYAMGYSPDDMEKLIKISNAGIPETSKSATFIISSGIRLPRNF